MIILGGMRHDSLFCITPYYVIVHSIGAQYQDISTGMQECTAFSAAVAMTARYTGPCRAPSPGAPLSCVARGPTDAFTQANCCYNSPAGVLPVLVPSAGAGAGWWLVLAGGGTDVAVTAVRMCSSMPVAGGGAHVHMCCRPLVREMVQGLSAALKVGNTA